MPLPCSVVPSTVHNKCKQLGIFFAHCNYMYLGAFACYFPRSPMLPLSCAPVLLFGNGRNPMLLLEFGRTLPSELYTGLGNEAASKLYGKCQLTVGIGTTRNVFRYKMSAGAK